MPALVARWTALEPRRRTLALVLAAALIAAMLLALLGGRETRVELFATPLRSEQIAEVAERLAEWNVPFSALSDNVRVEGKQRNELLLRLALAGVPHPHLMTTAETLDKSGPLTPQSVIDAQQRSGLAGDLASALRGLPDVVDAQVIIAPANEAAFAGDAARDATASVRLSLAPGPEPPAQMLDGIRRFVAAGVPGLAPERVAVLDDRGLSLAFDGTHVTDDAAALQASLQSALDLVLGPGSSIVRVRINYDPRVRALRDVVRRPAGARAILATTTDERFKSAVKQYTKTSASLDRGSEVQDERVDTPAGRVERLSVAIAVDARRRADLGKIRALASAALGLDPARGDVVSVEELPFPRDVPARAGTLAAALAFASALGPPVAVALAFVASLRASGRPLLTLYDAIAHRVALRRASRSATANVPPAQVRGVLQNEPPHTAAAIISALPAATATAVLEMYPPEERAAIVRRMSRAAAPVVPDCDAVLRRG